MLVVRDGNAPEGRAVNEQRQDEARQSLTTHATMKLKSAEKAELWMRSRLPALGGRRPLDVCVEDGGMERCRGLLR